MHSSRRRLDLTEWVIHYVHDRKPEDELYLEGKVTHFYDGEGKPQTITDDDEMEEFIAEDDSAFEVLKKIVHDGFIRSGWSFREKKPTVYGPYSAVCFTEMPLYAWRDYVKNRGWSGYVKGYGIGFKRSELFSFGARPVIYGLSGEHRENPWRNGMRSLKEECGIGLEEQYRYVATNLAEEGVPDWMHEREWRWPLRNGDYGVGGLPFLLSAETDEHRNPFSEILLFVQTDEEQQGLLCFVKNLLDESRHDVNQLRKIQVISLASWEENPLLKIESIPASERKCIIASTPDSELQKR